MKKLALALTLGSLLAPASIHAQNAYITNRNSSTVSVIDTTTDAVIATIPVGLGPFGVAVSSDGKVYITTPPSNTVSVIDTATNTLTATIPVGLPQNCGLTCPHTAVAVSPDGGKVYVTNGFLANTVSVIDTATNTVTATIPSPSPLGVAVTPDGSKVYVANGLFNGTVSVIDTTTNTVSSTITAGVGPFGLAVSPDGSKVYVTNELNCTVSVIDTATNTVSATIPFSCFPFPSFPTGVVVIPDGSKVYVANSGSFPSTVSVIDTATNTVSATVPVGLGPVGVAVNPDGSKVYVADESANTVSVIDTAANTVMATIPVGNAPDAFGIFIQPPAPKFAGVPGSSNCNGTSISALATKFGGLDAAAAALGFSNVQGLQDAIRAFCEG
jgi:YVTN family beta-propeller protein